MLRVIFSGPFWGRIRTPLTDSLREHGKSIFLCLKTNLPTCFGFLGDFFGFLGEFFGFLRDIFGFLGDFFGIWKSIFLCLETNLPPCPRNYFKKYESWDLHFLWRYKAGHLDISVSEQTFDRACRKMSFWLTSRPVQSSWVTSESFSSVFQNEHFHPWMEYYLSILES